MNKYNRGDAVALDRFEHIRNTSMILPGRLKAPLRVYCDVDGVVKPFGKDECDSQVSVKVFDTGEYYSNGSIYDGVNPLWFHKDRMELLSEVSHMAEVDFVWLTAWKFNAPYALDEVLGIKSAGWLDWSVEFDDYGTGAGKMRAIQNLHKTDAPEGFVWLEDDANKFPRFAGNFLNFQVDPFLGLTVNEIELVKLWVDESVEANYG